MTVAQLEELIRIRKANRSALKRNLRNVRTRAAYQSAEAHLENLDKEISNLEDQLKQAQGGAVSRALRN